MTGSSELFRDKGLHPTFEGHNSSSHTLTDCASVTIFGASQEIRLGGATSKTTSEVACTCYAFGLRGETTVPFLWRHNGQSRQLTLHLYMSLLTCIDGVSSANKPSLQ
ncbi:hypothetical protein TNCV_3479621 [Trichonephila clavipes]|nr:hypothetical protein TNCV_3479621 [Trichonephila clavipes]